MTLSRGPYSELDKMSLFQDLKLKRRKVDSRCSSDGESLADTSTSSPDLLTPLSPKMCDQAHPSTPNAIQPAPTPPAPSSCGGNGTSVQGNGSSSSSRTSPESPIIDDKPNAASAIGSHNVNNNGSMANPSVIRSIADERMPSPAPRQSPVNHLHRHTPSPVHHQMKMTTTSQNQQQQHQHHHQQQQQQQSQHHVTVLVTPTRIKTENQASTIVGVRKSSPTNFCAVSTANNFTTTTIKIENPSPTSMAMRKSNSPHYSVPVSNNNNNNNNNNGNNQSINHRNESTLTVPTSTPIMIQSSHSAGVQLHMLQNNSLSVMQQRTAQLSPINIEG